MPKNIIVSESYFMIWISLTTATLGSGESRHESCQASTSHQTLTQHFLFKRSFLHAGSRYSPKSWNKVKMKMIKRWNLCFNATTQYQMCSANATMLVISLLTSGRVAANWPLPLRCRRAATLPLAILGPARLQQPPPPSPQPPAHNFKAFNYI